MNNILYVQSSLFGDNGQSSQLAREFLARFPQARVVTRDLVREPLPHLDGERFGAFAAKAGARTPAQAQVIEESDALVAELRAADTVVIGAPLYNFGIPSQLKAWFDHIARAGVTFKYTEKGAVGLLTGKKAYVFAARGGYYAGTPADIHGAYLATMLGFLGITDVQFVHAEGLAVSAENKEAGLAAARIRLRSLAQPERIAA